MPKLSLKPPRKPALKRRRRSAKSGAGPAISAGRPAVKPGRATGASASKPPASSAAGPGKAVRRKAAAESGGSDVARLEARIRRLTAQLAEAKGRIDELEGWADTDFLLDILNRRGFERELTRAIAYIKRYKASGALIALDVDRLKPINDTYGHAAGDAVLKAIVNVVLRHIRSSDVVGRLGGDEFAVLLWNLSEADVAAKAIALEEAIDRLTFVFRGRSMSSGASTGVTMLAVTDDAAAALDRADRAMYARKSIRRMTRT